MKYTQSFLTLILLCLLGAGTSAAGDATETPGVCPYVEWFRTSEPVMCQCTIRIDRERLAAGALEVQFHSSLEPTPGFQQQGCSLQGMGGGLIVLYRDGQVVLAAHTGPIAHMGGPHFSNTLLIDTLVTSETDSYQLRIRHGDWTSNTVSFDFPVAESNENP